MRNIITSTLFPNGCVPQYQKLLVADVIFNPLNAELNPICYLLALLEGATIVVVRRLRVNTVIMTWTTLSTVVSGTREKYVSDEWVSGNCTVVSRDYKLLPVIRCVSGTLSLGSQGTKLTTHLHVIRRFTLSTAITALPHYAFMVCRGNITFILSRQTRSTNADGNIGKFITFAT